MSIESWSPDNSAEQTVTLETLEAFAHCVDENNSDSPLTHALISNHAWIMKKDKAFWQPLLEKIEPTTLLKLIGFFTLIEEQNQAWAAGSTNPVIYIFKYLRKSHPGLVTKEKIMWIKSNTQNRYLPYGPIL